MKQPRTFAIVSFALVASLGRVAANTALWIGNPGVTANTNWSNNANWNNVGTGGAGYTNNDVVFGGTGSAGAAGTVTSLADVTAPTFSMRFTNAVGQWHTVLIPTGTILTNLNGLTVGGLTNNDPYPTVVNFAGGGTLLQNGFVTVGNNGNGSVNTGGLLDLSGLSNFVMNASSATLTMGLFNRSGAKMFLANGSNYITCATIKANTDSSSSGVGNQNFTLGAGTNVINANTFNVGLNRATCTVNFPSSSVGGLRLRGTGGTDSDRTSMTLGNHNATGTGSTAAGILSFNGHLVDMKLGTLILGQSSAATTGGSNPGNGTIQFDTGTIDATTINIAIAGNTNWNSANGTITVGSSATLLVGAGGISMANLTGPATAANGTLTVAGGLVRVNGNISKANSSGTATISINPGPSAPGTLIMNALTNMIGAPSVPIDNFSISDSTLTVPTFSGTPSAQVGTLTVGGTTNTINITTVPGLGQFQVIAYASLNGAYNFNLGTLPGGFQGYLLQNANSIDLVITNSLAKTDVWRGNVSGNWNTTTANWVSGGNPTTFATSDTVIFDDTLTGTPNVVVTNAVAPGQISVANSSTTYVLTGEGKIAGTGSLTKDGSGSFTLAESGGDDFSGGITVNNGTLLLDNTNSAIGGGLVINGGAVQIGNNDGNGALPGGAITDNGSLIFARTNNGTVAVAITGSGSITKNGSGTLTLTGANAYTGNTVVNNGVLALSGSGTVSNSAQVQVSNATLDVSAISQSLFNALDLTNSSVTVSVNASGATPILANSLATGGPTNRINITALPAIASYPVTFTVIQSANVIDGSFNVGLGTLPAASPAYAGSISESPGQTAVLLTLTAGPIGTRPSVSWTGADVANLNTNWSDRLNWQLPGAPTNGDNVLFGNNGSVFSSSLSAPGGGPSALLPDQFNNIVDANFTVSSLTYTNIGGTYHNTHIADGRTLTITNSGGLSVGSLTIDAGATAADLVNISGPQGTLNVNNPNAVMVVALTSTSSGTHRATLDLSALGTFQANASRLAIGSLNTITTRPLGTAYLAQTNILTLGYTNDPAFTSSSDLRGLGVGDNSDPATGSARSFLYLGQTNRINVNSVGIGVGKSFGTVQFDPSLTAANTGPVVWFRGADGVSPVKWWTEGDGLGQTGNSSSPSGIADFTGGTVNALVTTMYLGRSPDASANGGTVDSTGTLMFDSGTISVGTLIAGYQPRNIGDYGVGVINVSSNATLGSGATLTVTGSLGLGYTAGNGGAQVTSGTLNITNGTVFANSIVPGTNNTQSAINLVGGKLVVTNAIGNSSGPLTSLNLFPLGTSDNSATLLQIPAPGVTVTSLTIDGSTTTTNVINVSSISNLISLPAELPLIQYSGMNVFGGNFNIGLGPLPPGYSGYLTNDTASNMVGLMITGAPPKPPYITSFSFQSGNFVATGTNGYAGATYYVIASTNVMLPRFAWIRIATNTFDGSGNFNESIPLDPTKPARFFSIQVP